MGRDFQIRRKSVGIVSIVDRRGGMVKVLPGSEGS